MSSTDTPIDLTQGIKTILRDGVFPPPIEITEDILENLSEQPGFVKRNRDGTLVKQYLELNGVGTFLIQIFDDWIENRLARQLRENRIELPDGHHIYYKLTRIDKPKIIENDKVRPMYPQDARNRKSTYSLGICARPYLVDPSGKEVVIDLKGFSKKRSIRDKYGDNIEIETMCPPLNKGDTRLKNGMVYIRDPESDDFKVLKTVSEQSPLSNNDIHIGDIPVMLGSKFCNLHRLSKKDMVAVGEDPDTARGYFIVEGKELVIIMREKIRFNKTLLYRHKDRVVCRGTYEIPNTSSAIVEVSYDKERIINFTLSSIANINAKKSKGVKRLVTKEKMVNVFQLFQYLAKYQDESGRETPMSIPDIIKKYILPHIKPKRRNRVSIELARTAVNAVASSGDHIQVFANIMEADIDLPGMEDVVRLEMERILDRDLFPNLNDYPPEYKLFNLGLIVSKLAENMAGFRNIDNRDSWANKRLKTAGYIMSELFKIVWNNLLKKAVESQMLEYQKNKIKVTEGGTTATISGKDLQSNWFLANIRDYIDNIDLGSLAMSIVSKVQYSKITEHFINSFSRKWGIKNVSIKDNVVQTLKRDNKLAAMSHILRIDIDSSHHTRDDAIRAIQETQFGFVCAVHTPEGGPCGLVKNMAITTSVTVGISDKEEREIIRTFTALRYIPEEGWIYQIDTQTGNQITFNNDGKEIFPLVSITYINDEKYNGTLTVNGKFLGWCRPTETYELAMNIKLTYRRRDISIIRDKDDNIEIYTDGSRLIRPLLTVNPQGTKLVMDEKKLNGLPFNTLLANRAAVYVDTEESSPEHTMVKLASFKSNIEKYFADIEQAKQELSLAEAELQNYSKSVNVDKEEMILLEGDVEKFKRKYERLKSRMRYTHCELHPQAILGISASVIPMPQTNQSARSAFQSGMATQALSIYHSNHRNRFDGTTKMLAFPANPIVTTEMERTLGLDISPQGEPVIVAFMSDMGMTGEDAFIFSQRAIDSGKFRILKYVTYTSTIVTAGNRFSDVLRLPHRFVADEEKIYHAIGSNGLPVPNSHLKEGDIVISSFREFRNETGDIINTSIRMGIHEEGIVDTVSVTEKTSGTLVVRVKLRTMRIPQAGDKFAARNAQKGTISIILPTEDMPFTESGTTPDIIVNPHAIPGRMTMEYLLEMFTGKVAALTGERINATPYDKFNLDLFFSMLTYLGYDRSGNEKMISGTTGEYLDVDIFIGPAYFQALKHHVVDKYQARGGSGGVKALTHQPVGGRSKGGGIRFGKIFAAVAWQHVASLRYGRRHN